jgi:A/G-specific adenine glycosylase
MTPAPMRVASPRATSGLIRDALLRWFDRHKRDLPWRRSRDPYAIWVSEVMLQQTQVATVIPYWHRFLERFPTVESLAAAELPEVFAQWRGLGYYTRARNLHRAAREIAARHGGRLPSTAEELVSLPGFGRYTSGAVASIAFGEEAALVDGNVARVLARLFEIDGAPGDRGREKRLWELAARLVRGPRPGDFNQAMMELGATVCRTQDPSCHTCPLRDACGAFSANRVAELPPPRVRAAKRPLRMAVAVWRRENAVLLARRSELGLFGGLWELPSVEIAGDAEREAIATALRALLGRIQLGEAVGTVKRTLTHRSLTLDLFEVSGRGRPARTHAVQEWRWVGASEADALGMSTAMQRAVEFAWDTMGVCTSTRSRSRVAG